ncbi:MAG: hypothetical protein U0W40_01465 [Acidimicrobiia bacterium]
MPGAALTVDHVDVTTDGDLGTQLGGRTDVDVTYTVRNTGTVTVHPKAIVRVTSQIGGGVRSPARELRALAPGESVTVHEQVDHVLPFGSVDAIVTVRSEAPTMHASASTPVVPWLLLALVAAALTAAVVWWVRRSRRGARRRGRSPRPPAA